MGALQGGSRRRLARSDKIGMLQPPNAFGPTAGRPGIKGVFRGIRGFGGGLEGVLVAELICILASS